jgi:hypothetical protein
MTDRDMDAFEARLEVRLRAHAAVPVAPVDADAVAHAAAVAQRGGLRHWPAFGFRMPALAWVALAIALAIAGGVLAAAALDLVHPKPVGPLVLATETGLYLGDESGTNLRTLRDDGSFLLPQWSPRGNRIAVLHGPPIPAHMGASGGLALTPAELPLTVSDVLILDDQGRTIGQHDGAAYGFAWGPPGPDGSSLLAVRLLSGDVVVLDARGRGVADLGLSDPVTAPDDDAFLASGLAWASPTLLIVADGARLIRFDAAEPTRTPAFVQLIDGRINGIGVSPNGKIAAFVVAGCRRTCLGEMRAVRIPPYVPTTDPSANQGRGMASDVEASIVPTWLDDEWVLTWPNTIKYDCCGRPRRLPSVPAPQNVTASSVRPAADGTSRTIVLAEYSAFNDRHYDAWLLGADGTVRRVGERSLGFDMRPASAAGDGTNGASNRP